MIKKLLKIVLILIVFISLTAFRNKGNFRIDDLYDYQKEYKSDDVGACALGEVKTYMDYRSITDKTAPQYWYIRENMTVDEQTGFLLDEDGFIGVALGSYYGIIGDKYYFTLDTGVTLPVVKIDEKDDRDTDSTGCYHNIDSSVIEFVVDRNIANEYYGYYSNGLVLQGNYANYQTFKGSIVKVEKVLEEKRDDYVSYELKEDSIPNTSIFNYASGY